MSILVGPNNSGKSTVIEAFSALSSKRRPSFPEGKRNPKADGRVKIYCTLNNPTRDKSGIRTINSGGSETVWKDKGANPSAVTIYAVPSRRRVDTYFEFDDSIISRHTYMIHEGLPPIRGQASSRFPDRLRQIQENPTTF